MTGLEQWAGALMASIFTGLMAGIGSAMAWFNRSKNKIHDRIDAVEVSVSGLKDKKADHDVRLERVETCQENTSTTLGDLKAGQMTLQEKMDRFYLDILNAIHSRGA